MATCRKCGQQIEYRLTAAGRQMPVDPRPVAVLTKRGSVVHGWTSHFSTCPNGPGALDREERIYQRRFIPV